MLQKQEIIIVVSSELSMAFDISAERNRHSLLNHVIIAHASPAAPYTNTVETESTRHHLNVVHLITLPTPSPWPSSKASDAAWSRRTELPLLLVLFVRESRHFNDWGLGHLCVNFSVVPIDGISAWCPESTEFVVRAVNRVLADPSDWFRRAFKFGLIPAQKGV